jgi:hypothetical protein
MSPQNESSEQNNRYSFVNGSGGGGTVTPMRLVGRNQQQVLSIEEEETRKTIQSIMNSSTMKEDEKGNEDNLPKDALKELKIVRHIYDNFEKHQLPICNPKEQLKTLKFKLSPYHGDHPEVL